MRSATKRFLVLAIAIVTIFSCMTKTDTTVTSGGVQLLFPDTTNNRRAQSDIDDINRRSILESQLGLSDLKNGADSLEIRLWYDLSLSISKDLYILKFQDTTCLLSYYRVYPRQIRDDQQNGNKKWNPFTDPIIDSSVSKSVLIKNGNLKAFHIDSIWFLKSQSELKISDSIGFTDCDSYVIEIADKKRFKYLRHHCPMAYYNEMKLHDISNYVDFCERIIRLSRRYDAILPYRYD
jgi:hypothetical protein